MSLNKKKIPLNSKGDSHRLVGYRMSHVADMGLDILAFISFQFSHKTYFHTASAVHIICENMPFGKISTFLKELF